MKNKSTWGNIIALLLITIIFSAIFKLFFGSTGTVAQRRKWLLARRDKLRAEIEEKQKLLTKVQKTTMILFKVSVATAITAIIASFYAAGKTGIVPLSVAGFGDILMIYSFISGSCSLLIFNKLIGINDVCENLSEKIEYTVYWFMDIENPVPALLNCKTELSAVELELQKIESDKASKHNDLSGLFGGPF